MIKKTEISKIFPQYGEQKCEFILGAHNSSQFPQTYYPEFAFIGASNVGKSSLINALIAQKVAHVSNTPGRTRQINFFKLADKVMIVDMPGYGFAKAQDKHKDHWRQTAYEYFANRKQLKRVFLLIDPIKGLKENDFDIVELFNELSVNFQIIFTKTDKMKLHELEGLKEDIAKRAKLWPALEPQAILTSSKTTNGVDEIKRVIINML